MKPTCPHCGGPTTLALSGNGAKAYRCQRAADTMRRELLEHERAMRAIRDAYEPHLRLVWTDNQATIPDDGLRLEGIA